MPEIITAIPTFNAARFLPETLDCLVHQTRKPDRIVVIDNCSTDETEALVRNHRSLKIEFRRNETNIGGIGNLNRCLDLAGEADFLHLLMADDLVLPGFLAKTEAVLGAAQGQGLAYVLYENINQNSVLLGPAGRPTGRTGRIPTEAFIRRQATLETVLLPGVLFKTDRRGLPCRFRDMPQIADGVFMAECARHGFEVHQVGEYLSRYRMSDFNASSRHRTSLDSFVRDEWRAMELVSGWIDESPLRRAITRAVLRCRFAARTEVKRQMFAGTHPDYAAEIDAVRREIAGPFLGALGVMAVRARDLERRFKGSPSRVEEIRNLQKAAAPTGIQPGPGRGPDIPGRSAPDR